MRKYLLVVSLHKYRISVWFIYFTILCFIIGGGCKSTERVKEKNEDIEYEFLCSASDYVQTSDFFRVHQIGESVDQPTSMKKGIQKAQQKLAGSITTALDKTFESYIVKDGIPLDDSMKEEIFAVTKPIGEELIEKVNIICEESIKTLNGLYRTYIVIEISADEVLSELDKKMKENTQLKVPVNSREFREIFEHHLSKSIQKLENL